MLNKTLKSHSFTIFFKRKLDHIQSMFSQHPIFFWKILKTISQFLNKSPFCFPNISQFSKRRLTRFRENIILHSISYRTVCFHNLLNVKVDKFKNFLPSNKPFLQKCF